jgi:hypothetical protein
LGLVALLQFLEASTPSLILLFQAFEVGTIILLELAECFVLRFVQLLLLFLEIRNDFVTVSDFGFELFVLLVEILECLFDFLLNFLDIFVD